MELIRFEYNKETTYCPICAKEVDCPECNAKLYYCSYCGEAIEKHEVFIVLTTEKYNGWDKAANHTATLIIDGKDFAFAHRDEDESDAGGDVAHLQLGYIPEEKQTEEIANIISSFAKWVRYDWTNPDKNTGLPTLVRLIGFTTDKRTPMPWGSETWIALRDATKIKVEHLAWEFTSKEIL